MSSGYQGAPDHVMQISTVTITSSTDIQYTKSCDELLSLGEHGAVLALLALEPRLELIVCIVCDRARAGRRAGEEPVRAENEGGEGEGVAWVSL